MTPQNASSSSSLVLLSVFSVHFHPRHDERINAAWTRWTTICFRRRGTACSERGRAGNDALSVSQGDDRPPLTSRCAPKNIPTTVKRPCAAKTLGVCSKFSVSVVCFVSNTRHNRTCRCPAELFACVRERTSWQEKTNPLRTRLPVVVQQGQQQTRSTR